MNADPSLDAELREPEIRSSLRSPELHGADRLRIVRTLPAPAANGVRHALQALQLAFVALPIAAGIDKFANVLTDWAQYLAPVFPNTLGLHPHQFLYIVGGVEILVGIGISLKPSVFAYAAAAWIGAIVVNLVVLGEYFDIALRDGALVLAAFALGRLASARAKGLA